MNAPLGLAGAIARRFLASEITPLLALTGLLMGAFAAVLTPREEEPQMPVTFANVFVPFPGASARSVEQLVATPAEQILSQLKGVEHIYSASRPGMAALTVQFEVGEPRTDALVRLYNAFYSNTDWQPRNLGVGAPIIKPKGIDDVPVVAATLWTEDPALGADDLARVAHAMETELQRVPGTRDIHSIGAPERAVLVRLDPHRLAGYGLDFDDLRRALTGANAAAEAGAIVADNRQIQVQAGTFLSSPEEVAGLVVGARHGAPVYLRDVADVRLGPDTPEQYVEHGTGAAGAGPGGRHPAVTVAVSKKPGTNATDVAGQVIERFEQMRGIVVPDGIHATVTRNYGATADDKATMLIQKLAFATLCVVLLVLLALGWREAIVVGAAVVVTLAVTLFASWAWGFTLNRVSLFALIFSIGILVDDAIVVVENIHRRSRDGGSPDQAIPAAVDEVGGPTILATFTVIAALAPMAFITGLSGPYMRPIPINASLGMLISLAVAFVFTPWLYRRVFMNAPPHVEGAGSGSLERLFARRLGPFLRGTAGDGARRKLLAWILGMIAASLALAAGKLVVLKMLPFDNKSEFQVAVDLPEGASVEQTHRVLNALADYVATVPEVTDYQLYAGTAAPINFNGLMRQYYLRRAPHEGDLQVNLVGRHERDRQSHEIALAVRGPLQEIGARYGATVRIVEVPPGPPVQAPIVAEVYGLDYARQVEVAGRVRDIFAGTADVVDVDDSIDAPQERLVATVDRARAARLGVSPQSVTAALTLAVDGEDVSYLHAGNTRVPVPLRLGLAPGDKADPEVLRALRVRAAGGALVPIGEVAELRGTTREQTIWHKDLLPVVFVTGDLAGRLDSPLYGMAAISAQLDDTPVDGEPLAQSWTSQPENPYAWSLKWDGEWDITYKLFRDMGIAYSVGLVLIYLLVVAQFRSYTVPLIIMAPIPLTLIGILPGHALLAEQFTATSMIGVIALAGIIVRNSILLVDFIQQEVRAGRALEDAVVRAGAVRARPIALTAVAAMLGAMFILDDPIFSGLAVSLVFGIFVATGLTLFVIPVVYYAYHHRTRPASRGAAQLEPGQPLPYGP